MRPAAGVTLFDPSRPPPARRKGWSEEMIQKTSAIGMAVLLAGVSSSLAQGQPNAQNLVTDPHNAVEFVISSEARRQELMDDGCRVGAVSAMPGWFG